MITTREPEITIEALEKEIQELQFENASLTLHCNALRKKLIASNIILFEATRDFPYLYFKDVTVTRAMVIPHLEKQLAELDS